MHRTALPLLLLAACASPIPPDGGFVPGAGCWEPDPDSVFVQGLPTPTAGCGLAGQPTGVIDLHAAGLLSSGGLLVVPPGDGANARALVLAFHGAGGTGEDIRAELQLEEPADGGAIFVYPNAPAGTWNVTAKNPDAARVGKLIQQVSALYCVDPQRIYAAGFSAGAVFTLFLGCNVPGSFRAIGTVAGADNRFDVSCCKPGLSAILIHGTGDDAIPFPSGLASAQGIAARDRCSPGAQPDGAHCSAYACPSTAAVDFCQWPGMHEVPFWAGEEMWRFFGEAP
jgi:polyhydroxybutyrate depolymerase